MMGKQKEKNKILAEEFEDCDADYFYKMLIRTHYIALKRYEDRSKPYYTGILMRKDLPKMACKTKMPEEYRK